MLACREYDDCGVLGKAFCHLRVPAFRCHVSCSLVLRICGLPCIVQRDFFDQTSIVCVGAGSPRTVLKMVHHWSCCSCCGCCGCCCVCDSARQSCPGSSPGNREVLCSHAGACEQIESRDVFGPRSIMVLRDTACSPIQLAVYGVHLVATCSSTKVIYRDPIVQLAQHDGSELNMLVR